LKHWFGFVADFDANAAFQHYSFEKELAGLNFGALAASCYLKAFVETAVVERTSTVAFDFGAAAFVETAAVVWSSPAEFEAVASSFLVASFAAADASHFASSSSSAVAAAVA